MRLILVLGMHRSGTSAVAGMLHRLGASVGHVDRLLPAESDNPRGFYENVDVKQVNDAVLTKLGGTWDDPPHLGGAWYLSPDLAPQRQQGIEAIEALEAEGDEALVVKDPRLSLTLPWWREITRVDEVVHCLRSPAAVARSLQRRNGLTRTHAERLWLTYTLHAVAAAPGAVRVRYEDLMQSPERVADDLAGRLDLPGTPREAASFVDTDLDHSTGERPRLGAAAWLHDLLRETDDDTVRDLAELLRPLLAGHGDAEADARAFLTRIEELEEGVERRDEQLELLADSRARLEESRERERRNGVFLAARVQRRTHDLGEATAAAREHRLASEGLRDERDVARREVELGRRREARAKHATERVQSELLEMEEMKEDLRQQRRETARELHAARRDLTRLRGRRSVRATLAVARLARPLFRAVRRHRTSGDDPDGASGPGSTTEEPAADEVTRDTGGVSDETLPDLPDLGLRVAPDTMTRPLTVVVPVHDAPADVKRCLDSVLRNTTTPTQVLVVDDASRESRTRDLLDSLADHPMLTVVRNDENLGYTRSVNRGIEESTGDVVLLNSDTVVPPRWTEQLRLAMAQDPGIGSVTALSDNAGAFSAPRIGEANTPPPGVDPEAAARLVAQDAPWRLPRVVTCNGFCVMLRREMLDDVGVFDAEAFPRGYGEENDLSLRASRAGWSHVVHDGLYVHHEKGASFGGERDRLIARGRAVVDRRYPEYTAGIRRTFRGEAMEAARERVGQRFDSAGVADGRPRALAVLHEGRGGTPNTTADLAATLADRWDTWVLTCDTRTFRLSRIVNGELQPVARRGLEHPIRFGESHRQDVHDLLVDLLTGLGVELLHVRHVVKNTFDVFTVARALGIPTVTSFHDFYLSCPTVHLLDDRGNFCGGTCTPGDGECRVPMSWIERDAGHLKHAGVHDWRREVAPHLESSSTLVTTSETARAVHQRSYPEAQLPPFEVIEHGRDLAPAPIPWHPPEVDERLRVLVPGNVDEHKGADYLRRLKAADRGDRIELHFLGGADVDVSDIGTVHGRYEREEFPERVAAIAPHLIGLFSVWAETYCHTLSEAWTTGIPVVVTDIGALGERVRAHGGGITVPVDDAGEGARRIIELADDPDQLRRLAGVDLDRIRSLGAMADDYERLYRRAIVGRAEGLPAPLDLDLLAIGHRAEAPGSVNVRGLRPLGHPRWAHDLSVRMTTASDLIGGRTPDHVHVQRTAVAPPEVEAFLEACGQQDLVWSFDVDDLLFDPSITGSLDPEYRAHVGPLQALLRSAPLITASTPQIQEAIAEMGLESALVPNQLDDQLWLRRVEPAAVAPWDGTRLLYVGSPTHDRDLALLRPVLEGLRTVDEDVTLTVVGVTRTDEDWYERLPVPTGCSHYPRFVTWLRSVAPGFDVAVAPLADTRFNRAKSDLKYLEYAALGLPAVYSDVGPYSRSVRDGSTGLLAGDVSTWISAIRQLVADPNGAADLAATARDRVAGGRTIATAPEAQLLAHQLLELHGRRR